MIKITTAKISHNQNHNHKKNSHKPKSQPQKFPMTKTTTTKFITHPTSYTQQRYFHNQNLMLNKSLL